MFNFFDFKDRIIYILIFCCLQFLVAQNKQLEIKISNDKFVLQDKYYTNGIHLTYRQNLLNNFLLKKKQNEKLQLNISFGNETYTPSNLDSFNVNDLDRPYAGWLFGKIELAKIKHKSALFLAVESGITGEESLAGKLQIAFHDLLNIDSKPTWVDEIAYKWLFNFKVSQVNDFQLNAWSNFQNEVTLSIGSKDTFLENNVYVFFGKINTFQNSSRIAAIASNSSKEFFGFLGGGYKYVLLNTLIQGSPFKSNDPFTTIAEKHVFNLKFGGVLRTKRNFFKLEYNYNTKETPLSKSHAFGVFTFGFVL